MLSSALSDSYLSSMPGNSSLDFGDGGGGGGGLEEGGKRMLSPEDALMPPLTMQDRHPSAPQLASMLTTAVEDKMSNVAIGMDESV